MLTVRPSAESGGQSDRVIGLQLLYVCAVVGATRSVAEAMAARVRIVDRMMPVRCREDGGREEVLLLELEGVQAQTS
jgi:hypothetical protein